MSQRRFRIESGYGEEPIIRVEEGWGKGAAKVNSSAVGV